MKRYMPFALMTLVLSGLSWVDDKSSTPENLIVNGNFEDGPKQIYGDDGGEGLNEHYGYKAIDKGSTEITGWVVTRGQIDVHANHAKAAKGRRSIDLNGSPGVGGIQQTIKTVSGKKYKLVFMFAGHPGKVEANEPEKLMGIEFGDQIKTLKFDTSGHTRARMGWVEKTIEFTATGDKTTIEFYSLSKLDRYCGPSIDDVRLYQID